MLAAHRGTADAAGNGWESAVYQKVQEEVKTERGLTIQRMLKLGGVSRAGFYRFGVTDGKPARDDDMDLRDAIQRVALEWPSYGRPRITAELRRQGWKVNPKRVHRLMREDNLLCVRKRKFMVATTDSDHGRRVYPNLAAPMELSGINQLWVADITYIRLETEFVYLAVVIDAFSRRGDRLGAGSHHRGRSHADGAADGARLATPATWIGASFRSREPIPFRRLHGPAEGAWLPNQHRGNVCGAQSFAGNISLRVTESGCRTNWSHC